MFSIDFNQLTKVALSAAGALLLTTGAFAVAAGPAIGDGAPNATHAATATMDAVRA